MYPKTQQMIEEKRAEGLFSSVAYQLIDREKETQQVLGWAATLPEKEALTFDHLFDVASLTKVVCTTSVLLRLLETKQMKLDQTLHTYLPAFLDERITIRHLLTHTSDIQTWIEKRDQLDQVALKAAYLTLQAGEDLGKKVCYTDAGTILLGFLLEELYQKPLTVIFQEEVLQPLGMTQSIFPPFRQPLVVPTEQLASGQILKGITHDPKARVLESHAGNAGLFTTLADLTRFVRMYLAGGAGYLKATTISALYQDHTPNQTGFRSLGWDLRGAKEQPILFHTGYTGTFMLIDVKQQQAFIFLSNRVHPKDEREKYIKHRDLLIATYLAEKSTANMI